MAKNSQMQDLMKAVAALQADMMWLKSGVKLAVASSLGTVFTIIAGTIVHALK